MMKEIAQIISDKLAGGQKILAVLLDPETCKESLLEKLIANLCDKCPDFIFIGGSHITSSIDRLIEKVKGATHCPVVLFPGDVSQFSPLADGILYLSLLSGRNPEYLIGQHIYNAIEIKESGIEVLPTGYILIEGGKISSVENVSNTRPIPRNKKEIVVSTAVAGELLGMKLIYLEAGSGALTPVSKEIISKVKSNISIPLIVGGGIKTTEQLHTAYDAGADIVVVGNAFESQPEKIKEFISFTSTYNRK